MKMLQNFYTPIQNTNHKLLSLSCWLRGKSVLPIINEKVKVVKICVKNNMDFKKCGSKVVGFRHFYISKYLCNNRHTIFLTGGRMKPPKEINYVLVECN